MIIVLIINFLPGNMLTVSFNPHNSLLMVGVTVIPILQMRMLGEFM